MIEMFEKTGRSQADLARHLGLPAPIINKMVKGRRLVKASEVDAIRRFFNSGGPDENAYDDSPARISGVQKRTLDSPTGPAALLRQGRAQLVQPVPVFGQPYKNVPIYRTLESLGGESFVLMDIVIGEHLAADIGPRAFSFYVNTDAAEPRYERGARVLVDPDVPLVANKDVLLLTDANSEGHQTGFLVRLLSIEAEGWTIRKLVKRKDLFTPRVMHLAKKDWPFAYRIVGLRNP